MPSTLARNAAATAVRAYLAEIGSVYLGEVYDPKSDSFSEDAWTLTMSHFQQRCAYCNREGKSLPKGVKLTREHLIETNQWQCGLHHPANVIPACSQCNVSRDRSKDGSRVGWEEHLQNLGRKHGWTPATVEKRRQHIQGFIDQGSYPAITGEEMAYLRKTAQKLYQDVLALCVSGRRGYVAIHGEAAVRIKPAPAAKKPARLPKKKVIP